MKAQRLRVTVCAELAVTRALRDALAAELREELSRRLPGATVIVRVSTWEEVFELEPPRPQVQRVLENVIARVVGDTSRWLDVDGDDDEPVEIAEMLKVLEVDDADG